MKTIVDDKILANAVLYPEFPSFYTNFYAAATILRIAKTELFSNVVQQEQQEQQNKESNDEHAATLTEFYKRLDHVEQSLQETLAKASLLSSKSIFVIVVEGLDGSGKSSLVEGLAKQLNGIATKTPCKSLKQTRPIFDKKGGPVARAYYMVSNYILQHEIYNTEFNNNYFHLHDNNNNNNNDTFSTTATTTTTTTTKTVVVVVDRWYASTCAYSVGQSTPPNSDTELIDSLDKNIFEWPHDLFPPNLMLLLQVNHDTRTQRISHRIHTVQNEDTHNDWDDQLSQNKLLAQRIQRCLERVHVPTTTTTTNTIFDKSNTPTMIIDGNQSKKEVLDKALGICQQLIKQNKI